MYQSHNINEVIYTGNNPIIDGDFDRFEMNGDFEESLREAEVATFYHDALDLEE